MNRKHLSVFLGALLVVALASHTCAVFMCGGEAHAVVGRPLTPMSYAGVARRTARRTTRRNVAYASGTVAALPGGCAFAGGIYACGAVRYRPYYDGPTVVYQVVH